MRLLFIIIMILKYLLILIILDLFNFVELIFRDNIFFWFIYGGVNFVDVWVFSFSRKLNLNFFMINFC